MDDTPDRSAAERTMAARMLVQRSWAITSDRSARTAPAREAFLARFEKQVDPDGVLDPAERAQRAEHARRAHFLDMSLRAAKVRRERRRAI